MSEERSVKNNIIIVLCITIVLLAIGFIVLSMDLNKTKEEKIKYDVAFTEVTKISSVTGGTIEPVGDINIKKNGQLLDMNFILNAAYDELIYNITIKNNGDIPVEIVNVIESPEYANSGQYNNTISPVTITLTDAENTILEGNDSTTIKLTVTYNQSSITGVKKFNYKLGLLTRQYTE